MKFYVYGKSYDRFDISTVKGTVTKAQFLAAEQIVKDQDDDAIEDFLCDTELDYDPALIMAAFGSDNEDFSLAKLLKGKAQFIWTEEVSIGVGRTKDAAKLAFLAGDE